MVATFLVPIFGNMIREWAPISKKNMMEGGQSTEGNTAFSTARLVEISLLKALKLLIKNRNCDREQLESCLVVNF